MTEGAEKRRNRTLTEWIRTGLFSSACIALVGVLILHLGLRLSWSELAAPLMLFATLHTVTIGAMFWFQRTRNIRIGVPIIAVYFAVLFSIVVHYASRWRLNIGLGPDDLPNLLISLFVVVIAAVVMPRRWTVSFFAEGVRCARCHHHHEGHDCTCGCRVDQFKYPVFGI
jgi:hypothetical protein